MSGKWIRDFRNPGRNYAPILFWSLNDDLKDSELRRQIRLMGEQGVGGFFMHSRVGLITPYLSKSWMDRIATCVREAGRVGIKAWLYDEDSYPSGFAGGLVPAKRDDFKAVYLRMENTPEKIAGYADVIYRFAARDPGTRRGRYRRLQRGESPASGEERLDFRVVAATPSGWFNGGTYIDTRNPAAVREFIRCTYAAYAKRFRGEFGKTIPGIFTDEPHFGGGEAVDLCWSRRFPEYFRRRKNYDILDHLPALFLDFAGCEKFRFDYWDSAGRMFAENFCRPIHDWCKSHGLKWTGHFWEHGFAVQHAVGSVMPCYEYMQTPGIDCLGNTRTLVNKHAIFQYGYGVMVKEAASVAKQLGRRRVLSESYGGGGWGMDFEEQKRFTDWECVLGINLINPHLSLYSIRGCRKRDFPPSFSFHQPWWRYYRRMNNYVTRLCFALSQGAPRADLLVVHPMSSAWLTHRPNVRYYDPAHPKPLEKLNDAFLKTTEALLESHWLHDFGDETIITRHGRVCGKEFVVGRGRYGTVLTPGCRTLHRGTFELLRQFAQNGGIIVAVNPRPFMLDGAPSRELREFMNGAGVIRVGNTRAAISAALESHLTRPISVHNVKGSQIPEIYAQVREMSGGRVVFLVNLDQVRGHEAEIAVHGDGNLSECDCETGTIRPLPAFRRRGVLCVRHYFQPGGALLLSQTDSPAGRLARAPARKHASSTVVQRLRGPWTVARCDPNALTLDICRYRIEQGKWSARMPVLKAQEEIRAHYGLDSLIGNKGVQFWKAYQTMKKLPAGAHVKLEFEFENALPIGYAGAMYLVVETPDAFDISVNGNPLFDTKQSAWIDPSFKKLDLTGSVRCGKNQVVLACSMRQDIEFDALYVIGDFAVRARDFKSFVLCPETAVIKPGPWFRRGYPFHAGSLTYSKSFVMARRPGRRFRLRFDRIRAAMARVLVNGIESGIRCWPPWELDITDQLNDGVNTVALEITSSLRNLLGPHHSPGVENRLNVPSSFLDERNWSEKYLFDDYGLLGDVCIIVSDESAGTE